MIKHMPNWFKMEGHLYKGAQCFSAALHFLFVTFVIHSCLLLLCLYCYLEFNNIMQLNGITGLKALSDK